MKKNLGKKNWMFPMPVLMIGTYGEDGTPDVMNAAWGGITLEDEITICIDTGHKTWANIAARKAFTVAFGTADAVKACDYLGIASGNKMPDKVSKQMGFILSASGLPSVIADSSTAQLRILPTTLQFSSFIETSSHSRTSGSSLTTGASTNALFVTVKPLFDTLSGVLLPLAMPR